MKPAQLIIVLLLSLGTTSPGQSSRPHRQQQPPEFLSSQLIFDQIELSAGIPDPYTPGIVQDRRGFIWLSNKKGLLRYDGLSFRRFTHDPADTSSLSDSFVWRIAEDRAGYLWIPTYAGGLNRYDPLTETFSVFPLRGDTASTTHPPILWSVTVDRHDRLWVGSRGEGLFIVSAGRDSVRHFTHDPADPTSLSSNFVGHVLIDSRGRFWVPTAGGGLNLFDPETGCAQRFRHRPDDPNSLVSDVIYSLEEDAQGRLWIPSWEGLTRFDPHDGRFTRYEHDPEDPNSLSDQLVYSVSIDSLDRVWLATGQGLDLLYPDRDSLVRFSHDPLNPYSLLHNLVFATYADRSGVRWISTAGGISRWSDPSMAFISLVRTLEEKRERNFEGGFKALLEDHRGMIWAGTNNGLYRYDPATDTYRHYLLEPNWRIDDLVEDPAGRIWVATPEGLYWIDPVTDTLRDLCREAPAACTRLPDEPYQALAIDAMGGLWIGSGSRLFRLDLTSLRVTGVYDSAMPAGTGFTFIRDIQVGPAGELWLAGDGGGLQRFDVPTQTFTPVPVAPDLPASLSPSGNSLFRIDARRGGLWVELSGLLRHYPLIATVTPGPVAQWPVGAGRFHLDRRGRYWLVRPEGIQAFDPRSGPGPLTALPASAHPLDGSLLATRNGELYLGGHEGLYRFRPDRIRRNTVPPAIVLTDFRLANRSVPIRGSRGDTLDRPSPLAQSVSYTDRLRLSYDQNDFTLEFAALDFHQPQQNRYKYILEGYPQDTLHTTADRPFATYTNLVPGAYTFRVWGSNAAGVWSDTPATVSITILAPWYWAAWSKALYGLLALLVLGLFYHFQLQRRLAAAESRRLQEMDVLKTQLYTDISHEFRTPLTVISGMARQIQDQPQTWLQQGVPLILRNSERLLTLVNQLLNLSRLEAGRLPLDWVQDDIIPYLRNLGDTFQAQAAMENIRLHLLVDVAECRMDFDPDKTQTILSNLIGNAIKFTPVGGDIYLRVYAPPGTVTGGELTIRVRDTGPGIPADRLPFIFDRYYQVTAPASQRAAGTGIGLALTRELVKLLGGTIAVRSEEGSGTEFTLRFPIRRSATAGLATEGIADAPAAPVFLPPAPEQTAPDRLPLALLIEDNADVLFYLSSCLQGRYRLLTATDGQAGIERAIERVPDIIISDVMMPERDGWEVVATLKADERTSHIPIILLTAKADAASRLEGLARGADAYLAKPFDRRELDIRLRELVALRQRLQARYGRLDMLDQVQPAESPEGTFLIRVRQIIDAHLEEERFGITELCQEIGISRTQLHRKLKALTGQSTSHVIRTIRLQRAKQLLEESNLNVSEIAYAVGFANRSHFTTVFTETYGQAPSYFRAQRQ